MFLHVSKIDDSLLKCLDHDNNRTYFNNNTFADEVYQVKLFISDPTVWKAVTPTKTKKPPNPDLPFFEIAKKVDVSKLAIAMVSCSDCRNSNFSKEKAKSSEDQLQKTVHFIGGTFESVLNGIAEFSVDEEKLKRMKKTYFTDTNFYRLKSEKHQLQVLEAIKTGVGLDKNKLSRGSFILFVRLKLQR